MQGGDICGDSVNSVTVQIKGGLGNQLFQYYAGIWLSHVSQSKLILNFPLNHKSFHIHGAVITDFNLVASSITYKPLESPTASQRLSSFLLNSRIPSLQSKYPKNSYFIEDSARLLDIYKNLHGEIKIDGYFQSNEIVDNAACLIPSIFENYEKKLNPNLQALKSKIRENSGIAVHVRRGDYRNSANSIGMLGPHYYSKAIREFEKRNFSGQFFVFSDEIHEIRNELGKVFPKSTNWVGLENYISPSDSLYLMSTANAFIISNSTFAWWAAKLGSSSQTVFYPSHWRKDGTNVINLIPNDWLGVKAQFL